MKLVFAALFLGLFLPAYAGAEEAIKVALLSASAQSALYKWQDSDGRIHYSDQPPKGSVAEYTPLPSLPKGYVGYEVKTPASATVSAERYPLPPTAKTAFAPSTKVAQLKPDLTATLVWLDSRQR